MFWTKFYKLGILDRRQWVIRESFGSLVAKEKEREIEEPVRIKHFLECSEILSEGNLDPSSP